MTQQSFQKASKGLSTSSHHGPSRCQGLVFSVERLTPTQCFYGHENFDSVPAKLKLQTGRQPPGARQSPPGNLPETGPVSLPALLTNSPWPGS